MPGAKNGRAEIEKATSGGSVLPEERRSYLRAEEMAVNFVFRLAPTFVTEVMIASEMREARRPYSMAVVEDFVEVPLRQRRRSCGIAGSRGSR